jgi:cell wall assembly regulator SMI1
VAGAAFSDRNGFSMSSIAASWRTIEAVLWDNAHSVYRALRKPATDTAIARLARLVPAKLPRDFVQSLKVHDGLRNSYHDRVRLFDYNALLPLSAIVSEYKMMCGLQAECEFPGNHSGSDPGLRNDAHWRKGWVPIMDADGDKLVLDLDPAPGGSLGQVFDWSNNGSTPQRVLAPSFGAWLAGLAEELGKRRFRLNEFGGIWLGAEGGSSPWGLESMPPDTQP